jgi:hypothetical protein
MTAPGQPPHVRELAPGDHEVVHDGRTTRVLVPAGVGIPGLEEHDLVVLVVDVLLARDGTLPAVLDLSQLLGEDPALRVELDRRADELD